MGDKTTNIHKQNPICNGFYIDSESKDVLQSSYHSSSIGYDNVDWFANEVLGIQIK